MWLVFGGVAETASELAILTRRGSRGSTGLCAYKVLSVLAGGLAEESNWQAIDVLRGRISRFLWFLDGTQPIGAVADSLQSVKGRNQLRPRRIGAIAPPARSLYPRKARSRIR